MRRDVRLQPEATLRIVASGFSPKSGRYFFSKTTTLLTA